MARQKHLTYPTETLRRANASLLCQELNKLGIDRQKPGVFLALVNCGQEHITYGKRRTTEKSSPLEPKFARHRLIGHRHSIWRRSRRIGNELTCGQQSPFSRNTFENVTPALFKSNPCAGH